MGTFFPLNSCYCRYFQSEVVRPGLSRGAVETQNLSVYGNSLSREGCGLLESHLGKAEIRECVTCFWTNSMQHQVSTSDLGKSRNLYSDLFVILRYKRL